MKHLSVGLLALAWACSGQTTGTDTTGPTGPTGETGEKPTKDTYVKPEPASPDLVITDANNYTYTADWGFPSFEVREMFENLTLSWGEVSEDAWGVERVPTTYHTALLLQVGGKEKDFVERWNTDDLNEGNGLLGLWSADIKGRNLIRIQDFDDVKGVPLDVDAIFNAKAGGVFFLGIADFDGDRYDVRIGAFLDPIANDVSRIDIGDGDTTLTVTADVAGAPVQTAEVHEFYTADWRGVDSTVYGTDYNRFLGDQLFIGHWAGGTTTKQLAADLHDLKPTATSWWTADIEGDNDIRLELARDDKRLNFPGFTKGGTWVIGSRCATCYGAAPWWMTLVEVE